MTPGDVSHNGFKFGTCREIELGGVTVLASRISYVGELGWELYAPMEEGRRVWDTVWEAGQPHGLVPVGIGVYGTTGRLEKGYRAYGAELDGSYDLVEAGMTRPSVKEQEFLGKDAYLAQRSSPPCALLCTLTVDDHRSASGQLRYMLGGEPVLTAGRRAAGRRQGPAVVRDQRGFRALGGQAPADGLPACRAGGGGQPAGR